MAARSEIDEGATLFLTADAPFDGGSGGQIVSWRLIRAYASLGPVDILAIVPEGARPHRALLELARSVRFMPLPGFHFADSRLRTMLRFARAHVRREPFRIEKFRHAAFASAIEEWDERRHYSVLHCDHLSLAQYRTKCPKAAAILCEHNVEWQQFRRLADLSGSRAVSLALRADSRRTEAWEANAVGEFSRTLCLSEHDRALLAQARPDLADRMVVWPVPVYPAPHLSQANDGSSLRVLVLGSMRSLGRVHGARWLINEVWPGLRRRVPHARLDIVGSSPPGDLAALDGVDGIRIHGYVEDLDPFLAAASVCAIPLFVGAGVRIKILEMVSRGIPCIGTPLGLQGMAELDGCKIADGVEQWISTLESTADDPRRLREAAKRGRDRLAVDHSPDRAAAVLHQQVTLAREGFPDPT